jgi:type II secretory pathway pseudopilin PulG
MMFTYDMPIIYQKNKIRNNGSPMRKRAFSMMETVVSISLVSILLIGSLNTLAFSTNTTARDLDNLRAAGLAEQLFSEMTALNYIDPIEATTIFGREASETNNVVRSDWDDIDDYHGLNETTLRYRDGTAMPNTTGWVRRVAVTGVVPSTLAASTDVTRPLRRVTVTLERNSSQTYTFQYFVSRDGFRTPQDLAPTIQPDYETEWQLGSRRFFWGVPLRNMPLAPSDTTVVAPPITPVKP